MNIHLTILNLLLSTHPILIIILLFIVSILLAIRYMKNNGTFWMRNKLSSNLVDLSEVTNIFLLFLITVIIGIFLWCFSDIETYTVFIDAIGTAPPNLRLIYPLIGLFIAFYSLFISLFSSYQNNILNYRIQTKLEEFDTQKYFKILRK